MAAHEEVIMHSFQILSTEDQFAVVKEFLAGRDVCIFFYKPWELSEHDSMF